MLAFHPIASSSAGNAYIVSADDAPSLLLDPGIPVTKIREWLSVNKVPGMGPGLSGICACLSSHGHGDHSNGLRGVADAGITCYMSHGTAKEVGIESHHRVKILSPERPAHLPGGWSVVGFPALHDAAEPMGFLIRHGDEKLLFLTDSAYIVHRFAAVNIIAAECNHVGDILSGNIADGRINRTVGRRVRRNHMSLETLIAMLKANDLSRCRRIYLLHLSDSNSDESRMVREVQEETGIPTTAC